MDASTMEADKIPAKRKPRFSLGAHNHVLEYIANTNLFMLCCVAACFSLISYLAAFSCEISWILEAHGNLPTTSYLLCSGYFILFVASTILIHGLATGLSWGLFSWSVIIGVLGIPELCLVMMITTQFWGLQSIHGLTELISYIIRLIINCLALLCVIPTALRWRREQEVLKQLQGLASRLQLQTPPPSTPKASHENLSRQGSRAANKRRRRNSGQENPAFIVHESQLPFPYVYGVYGSQNEFNASIFGLDPSQFVGDMPTSNFNPSRTRSLLDLRSVPPLQMMPQNKYNHPPGIDENDGPITNKTDQSSDAGDPIYCTIGSDKGSKPMPLMRNCVSLENLGGITIKANDLITPEQHRKNAILMQQHPNSQTYNPAIIMQYQQNQIPAGYFPPSMNINQQWPTAYPSRMQPHDYWHWSRYGHHTPNVFTTAGQAYGYSNGRNNNVSNTTSKQSLGSDDYRKYRDVAL